MSWLLRGIQSAVFHYASCGPCTGYVEKKRRAREAKLGRKAREKLQTEQPDLYHHPEPTGTNPFWNEEIAIGPGPPPRRARKTNTSTTRTSRMTRARGSIASQGASSIEVDNNSTVMRMSDDTLEDDANWNRKLYQREDEQLWGFSDALGHPLHATLSGSSVGVAGLTRPSTSRTGSQYSVALRAPPVNDFHPPVVSLPSPHPSDNQWMFQPPPKASVMSGKERATYRSRSGSGASSRVELSLQRQVSAKQLRQKLERGETPEVPLMSRGNSYSDLVAGQRHDRPTTPQTRPPSAASSRHRRRRDTATTRTEMTENSSGDSSDTPNLRLLHSDDPSVSKFTVVRVRSNRQLLSTVFSTNSGDSAEDMHTRGSMGKSERSSMGRESPAHFAPADSSSIHFSKQRARRSSSDMTSLKVLQDLVSPQALLNSRFVSAPLIEAHIRLPPSNADEQETLDSEYGEGLGIDFDGPPRVPFDSRGASRRDPKMRWSVDF